tara:strand:- start:4029 stop:4247 length:219 start_codon:yes stop_codon:yes gene_type:complete
MKRKLNLFEKHCLHNASTHYLETLGKEIQELEKGGKKLIVTLEYYEQVFQEIYQKLNIDVTEFKNYKDSEDV